MLLENDFSSYNETLISYLIIPAKWSKGAIRVELECIPTYFRLVAYRTYSQVIATYKLALLIHAQPMEASKISTSKVEPHVHFLYKIIQNRKE